MVSIALHQLQEGQFYVLQLLQSMLISWVFASSKHACPDSIWIFLEVPCVDQTVGGWARTPYSRSWKRSRVINQVFKARCASVDVLAVEFKRFNQHQWFQRAKRWDINDRWCLIGNIDIYYIHCLLIVIAHDTVQINQTHLPLMLGDAAKMIATDQTLAKAGNWTTVCWWFKS